MRILKSLRYRLLSWFVLSTVLLSAFSFLLFQFHKSTKISQQKALEELYDFRYQFIKSQSNVANFLANETTNELFFMSGESDFLTAHYQHSNNIDNFYINSFFKQSGETEFSKKTIQLLRDTYANYSLLLDSLVYKIYQRGYKNYGLEGELASYMYKLESSQKLPATALTKLKTAGNEYIIRYDTSYISEVNTLCNTLITNLLHNNNNYSIYEKEDLIRIIKQYKTTFNTIVSTDAEIGVRNNGLKQQISEVGYKLEELVNSSITDAQTIYTANMFRINIIFGILALLIIGLSFTLSVYTSRYLVKHLEQLTNYISSLSKANFNKRAEFDLRHSTSEIKQIYLEFRNMFADLRIRENQRNKALKIAKDNQRKYQELSDLLPQCIFETDRFGYLTYINKAWFNTFGYTNKDIKKGLQIGKILNISANSRLLGYTKIENNDYVATRKDGTQFPVTVYSDVIKKGVRVSGRRGIIIDATLRNKYIDGLKSETARAINSDKHKSSFLANMSHEIRTPMNSIIGFTNMLASKDIPEEMKGEFLDHIQTSSDMLLNLIDDIIDIAKIEDGQLKIKKTDCNAKKLIDELTTNFEAYKSKIDKTHIDIRVNLPEKDIEVRTDTFRLKQILTNLISNAIKFTENGWIEIGLRAKNQRLLEFYVEDTGIGMTNEDLQNIFERFKRTELSEEKKISGTGLGLAISKNLVEMLGGNMWVISEQDKGTRFSFEIPYIRVATPNKIIQKKSSPTNINWKDKKFLIAEDDDFGYKYLAHILQNTGAGLIRANNGKEVLEALSFHKDVDLVLMDLRMPILNGIEATKLLKQQYPNLPVIAQTAYAMEGDRIKCIEAGCDDYITKPINAENLLAKINQFIIPTKESANKDSINTELLGSDTLNSILTTSKQSKN